MQKSFAKILIVGGVLIALFALYRGVYYAPNDVVSDADSGLEVSNTTTNVGAVVASASTSSYPSRLLIPKLDIDTNVQALGVTKKGNMAAPSNFTDVSWYKYGPLPGRIGSAVMSGHEDNALSLDGIFKHLEDLNIGDDVYVLDKNGTKLHFKVTEKKIYPYNLSGPELERVFNAKDKARLNLITCTGEWVQAIKTNDQRLVVYTELVND